MASKFQNRMAGTIILVAIGVIVIPGLLDGKKKHYKEEFAAIPLVPKPGDQEDNEMLPPVTQSLPSKEIQQQAASQIPQDKSSLAQNDYRQGQGQTQSQVPSQSSTQANQEAAARREAERVAQQQAKQRQAEAQAAERARQQQQQALAQQREMQQRQTQQQTQPAATHENAVAGRAYVIQLGALKNAARVSQVVSELRSAGYQAYSIPSTPVQGQINRILVGPDSSKSNLQSQLSSLKAKSGLTGVVIPYRAH